MDKNGNAYTFIYASVMVVLVAAVLSFAAMKLKAPQDRNVEIEKQQSILKSLNIDVSADKAEQVYKKTITDSYIVNTKGDKVNGDAFTVNLKEEHAKPVDEQKLPVYVADLGDQGKKYIIPVRGTGLWGPIWGYLAFDSDLSTIYGATFDNEGETPGLGAQISTEGFQKQFAGKSIFNSEGKFVSIFVAKASEKGKANPKHSVDAISGGTITSKGLQKMLQDDLSKYTEFFKKLR